jgi:integrase
MSYIPNIESREEYISSLKSNGRRGVAKSALKAFDLFCSELYQKKGDIVLKDLSKIVKESGETEKIYYLLKQYTEWLNIDHPNIVQKIGMNGSCKRIMKRVHPTTLRNYLGIVRNYFEDVGGIEINDRKLHKKVKLHKIISEDPDPFTHDEIRLFCDNARPKQKLLYMFLKDTGCRIGETVALRKKHIKTEKNPIEIHIPASFTKTGKSRIAYITSETRPMLLNRLQNFEENNLIFGVNEMQEKSVDNEEQIFAAIRKKIGLIDRYESNNRFKKNIHSFRAFACTQVADVHGEEFAHGYVGHSKMLPQYIRYKEKLSEKFKQVEPKLMIYEKIEIVDSDERVKKLEIENKSIRKDMLELTEIMEQLSELKANKARQEIEIQMLKEKI